MLTRPKKIFVVMALLCGLTSVGENVVQAERSEAPATSSARTTAKQLVAGMYFTCSLAVSGTIRCWGDNTYGQLGNGSTNSAGEASSVGVIGITNATEIAAGAYHACALLADGRVKCWGYGLYGQLGNGSKGYLPGTWDPYVSSTPVFVRNSNDTDDLTNVTSVSAGYDHTCAVISGGTVKCWGQTQDGALGNGVTGGGSSDWRALPVSVQNGDATDLSSVSEIAAGMRFTCALLADGAGKCWGSNRSRQLGRGISSDYGAYADSVAGVSNAIGLTAGTSHACFLKTNELLCAGGGDITPGTPKQVFGGGSLVSTPLSIAETNAKQIAASDSATCILTASSTVKCAGGIYVFDAGQQTTKPDGTGTGPSSSFMTISGLSGVVGLVAGGEHFCAMLTSGMKCWGRNNYGQLGDGGRSSGASGLVDVQGIEAATITIGDPGAKNVGSAAFDLSASSSSGAPVTLSVDSSSSAVCSISGVRLTILNAGSCVVNGVSAPSGIYSAGSGSRTLSIGALQPTIASPSAGSVTVTGVTLSATVNARGASTTVTIEYGTSDTLVGASTTTAGDAKTGNSASVASKALSGLSPGTTYYFRFSATNSVGTTVGAIATFGTAGAKPTVTTGAATPETFAATLAGEVNANEVDATVSFEYGSDSTLAKSETATVTDAVSGSTAKSVSAAATKLSPGTTYYYRVVATNSVGTSRGDIKSFTTKGSKPAAITGSATRGSSGMTVNGKVNPKDLETSVRFEYGTDSKLAGAQQTAAKTQIGPDDVDVSAVISGLAENTTYYYRIIATNVVGAAEGDIKSFTTTRPEGVSINDGEEFTSSENVIVSVVGPSTAVKAILSNDGGFKTSETFDLTNNSADINWKLQSSREGTFTKIVYVKYVSRFGSQSQPVTDDIILDTTKPVMSAATATAAAPTGSAVQVARTGRSAKGATGGVRLSLRGSDTISGIGFVEVRSASNKPATKVTVSRVAGKTDGKPRATSQTVTLRTSAKRLQVRVIDRAGNASAWRTITVK